MEKRRLGNSDLLITPVAFGAWAIGGWMWGGADRKAAIEAIEASIDLGMTSIDTAPVYGFGLSEEIVGEVIRGKRDKVEILTKFGLHWEGAMGSFYFSSKDNQGKDVDIYRFARKEAIIRECERSLKRLRTDYIDLFQLHWPDPSTPVEETMEALGILIGEGKIRAAGVCNYDVPLLQEALKVTPLASNQVPYSMVRREIEKETIPYCLENSMGILAYSPLQRGLLTGKFSTDHNFKEGDTRPSTPYYKNSNLKRINAFLDELKPFAAGKGATLAQLVLRWTIEQPGITCALAGARNAAQVRENIGCMNFSLSIAEIKFINSKLEQLKLEI